MNKRSKTSKKVSTPTTQKKSNKKKTKSKKKRASKDININADIIISEPEIISIAKDFPTLIKEAIEKLSTGANATKDEIRSIFDVFRNKLNEREAKLLHDVDTTMDKKYRLLQTQLEYVEESGNTNSTPVSNNESEVACDANIGLTIDKQHIIQTLMTAGWIEGASSDNKQEQQMIEFEQKRRELSKQQFVCIERLKQMTLFERDCNKKKEDSIRLTKECKDEIQRITIRTKQCEDKLNEAKPILEAAKKLVSGITKEQLNEIRALKKPPRVVELVITAVALILGKKINNWRDIKKQLLSNPKFVSLILEFDTMSLTKKRRMECMKCVKHKDFNEERANKASKVAGPLVKWVNSQIRYSELLDVVRPMMKEIKMLKKKLENKQNELTNCQHMVNDLENKISKARVDINEMVDNMIAMQDKYDFKQDYFSDKEEDDFKNEP